MTQPAICKAPVWIATVPELKAFARLIVERCAVECDLRIHAGDTGAAFSAKAIRQLLEDK